MRSRLALRALAICQIRLFAARCDSTLASRGRSSPNARGRLSRGSVLSTRRGINHFTVVHTNLCLSTRHRKTAGKFSFFTFVRWSLSMRLRSHVGQCCGVLAGPPKTRLRLYPCRSAVSILAAMDVTGFFGGNLDDTFTRFEFHKMFKEQILPFLNPWPLPRSIGVMDNAKIYTV
jgi:hypothetical protein